MSEYEEQAEKFLKDTGFNLDINYKEFNSMSWDKNGQKRNIFEVELSKGNKSYKFDFGNCVMDSCQQVNSYDLVEEFEIFSGFKYVKSGVSVSIKFTMSKEKIENVTSEFINKKAEEFLENAKQAFAKYAEDWYNTGPKYRGTSRERDDKKRSYDSDLNIYIKKINDSIVAKLKEYEGKTEYSKDLQLPDIVKPSSYDILAGLYVCYYESPDEVVEEFGCMKPSQAIAIYEQDQELQKLFTEKELELLSEIN